MMENPMSERIRTAWGVSSLGDVLVAVSERGLVAFEFVDHRAAAMAGLRERLPEAELVEDEDGLFDLTRRLEALVDQPMLDPEIALDPRGTPFQRRVWSLLREIPVGRTANYGEIAARLGSRDPRDATEAIAANAIAILIPCHRVVKKDGSLSGYRWGARRKRALLERERHAVPFELA
jgi:AraC family transcriptional regulator of adaptative response/methylated-DNA-[protein]-cysteine methyltransferase